MRTTEEIEKAIERLKENKEKSHRFNYFGEDNHDRIEIMIDVIKNKRSADYVYETYDSQFEDGTEDTIGHGNWSNAMNAVSYLEGDLELEELLYPEIK